MVLLMKSWVDVLKLEKEAHSKELDELQVNVRDLKTQIREHRREAATWKHEQDKTQAEMASSHEDIMTLALALERTRLTQETERKVCDGDV